MERREFQTVGAAVWNECWLKWRLVHGMYKLAEEDEADKGWLMTTIDVSEWMFLLVPAHPVCPGQNQESRKMVVCVCVCVEVTGPGSLNCCNPLLLCYWLILEILYSRLWHFSWLRSFDWLLVMYSLQFMSCNFFLNLTFAFHSANCNFIFWHELSCTYDFDLRGIYTGCAKKN